MMKGVKPKDHGYFFPVTSTNYPELDSDSLTLQIGESKEERFPSAEHAWRWLYDELKMELQDEYPFSWELKKMVIRDNQTFGISEEDFKQLKKVRELFRAEMRRGSEGNVGEELNLSIDGKEIRIKLLETTARINPRSIRLSAEVSKAFVSTELTDAFPQLLESR